MHRPTMPSWEKFKLVWTSAEKLGSLVGLILVLLTVMGFRIEKPTQRFAMLERQDSLLAERVTKHEHDTLELQGQVNMLVRMRCLSMTRAQIALLNVPECDRYKTADDTARRRR